MFGNFWKWKYVIFETKSWWKYYIYWLQKGYSFNLFGNGKYGIFLRQKVHWTMIFTDYWKAYVLDFSLIENTVFFMAKKLMERWYLHGLFELFMIFQDLGNMAFCAMIKNVSCVKILNLTILCKQYFACSV